MIPEKSTETIIGKIIPPNNYAARRTEDWSMGGVAIQDPSQGLEVQEWRAWWDEGSEKIFLTAPNQPGATELYTMPDLHWLTIGFDQSMRWLSSYTLEDGSGGLRWYDPTAEAYVDVPLATGTTTPFLTMDDTRAPSVQSGSSDVLLTYIRDGALYVRVQRERFLTERLIAADIQGSTRIWRFGMNNKLRLQWELR